MKWLIKMVTMRCLLNNERLSFITPFFLRLVHFFFRSFTIVSTIHLMRPFRFRCFSMHSGDFMVWTMWLNVLTAIKINRLIATVWIGDSARMQSFANKSSQMKLFAMHIKFHCNGKRMDNSVSYYFYCDAIWSGASHAQVLKYC